MTLDPGQLAVSSIPVLATGAVAFFAKKFVSGVDRLEQGHAEIRKSLGEIKVELIGLDGTNGLRGDVRDLRRDHDELKEYVDRHTPGGPHHKYED
jgi:hypothetical protein